MLAGQTPADSASLAISVAKPEQPTLQQPRVVESSMMHVERLCVNDAEGIQVPLLLLLPAAAAGSKTDALEIDISKAGVSQAGSAKKWPVVLYVQTFGTSQQLKKESRDLGRLLAAGHAICLCDVRGTAAGGRDARSDARLGRTSVSTSISADLLMLGDPLLAGQLRDLRSVWGWLRDRPDIDLQRMKVWADSRHPSVTAEADRVVPRDDDGLLPPAAEPSACLLALLLSLFEDSVHSLCLSGGLSNFSSALGPMQVRVPHDCVLPGLFRAGDIEELIVQAAERLPVRYESPVDGRNRLMSPDALDKYQSQLQRLIPSQSQLKLTLSNGESQAVEWLSGL